MKVEHLTDPGGHVGPPGSSSKKDATSGSGLDDSDSGLDTTSTSSLRSNSKTSTNVGVDEGTTQPTITEPALVVITRKKPPFMGLALKRNPDLRSGC